MSNTYGKALEDALGWSHNQYKALGLALIFHNKWVGKFVGKGKFVPEKSRPDFTGILRPSGRMISFDAKSVGALEKWKLKKERKHQYRRLAEYDSFGAISFFLIFHRPESTIHLIRIRNDWPVEDERPYVLFKMAEHYAESELLSIKIDNGKPFDYLPTLLNSSTFISSLGSSPRHA